MDLLDDHEILLGTYEAFVLGYKIHRPEICDSKGLFKIEATTPKRTLKTSFANHAHSSSVRSIATGDKFLVSAGVDENVKIFNLRNRTEHGDLTHADGVINCMLFYDKRHLVTASEDGKICILKTKGWGVEKTLLKHRAGVTDLAIHPSGKLMLSVGKDGKLITWNLIKGRTAFITNLKENADFVRWSPSGNYYAVGCYKHIDIYSVNTASIEFSIILPGRTNEVVFLDDVTIAVAGEMPQIEIHSIISKNLLMKFDAHANRVRCMTLVPQQSHADKCEESNQVSDQCLVTASNDGFVKIWKISRKPFPTTTSSNQDISLESKFDVSEEAQVDTKCRITCLKIHKVPPVVSNQTIKVHAQKETKRTLEASLSTSPNIKKSRVQISEPLILDSSVTRTEVSTKKKKCKVLVLDEMKNVTQDSIQKTEDESENGKSPKDGKKKGVTNM